MNTNHKRSIFHRWLPAISIVSATIAMPVIAHAQATATTKMRVVAASEAVSSDGDKDAVNETMELRIDNGKLTVIRNGVEIPASQLKHDGNGIIILDQHGNKVEGSNIRFQGSSGGLDYVVSGAGEEAPMVYKMLGMDPGEAGKPAPKVMLGVHMTDTGPALEYHLGLEHGKTTMIMGVFEGLPAHDAGIRQFDIITKVNGKSPADNGSIREALADKDAGDTVAFTIIHEGKSRDVAVKLQKYDGEAMDKAKLIGAAPEAQFFGAWNALRPGVQWSGALDGLQELQQIYVTPGVDIKQRMNLLTPEINARLKEHLEKAVQNAQPSGVEAQLERLDRRMAELEEMLEKLIEQNSHNR